ncbi:selenocysteine insertion sequence-binding protein 2 [Rana temporaria]|uniref:selenocysteine insertion sequence-binding protein 2 n=1 Tax=Rana temporaria TaxID=8407 RepID=UPI001AAD802D|nr:selenocysteine insertion sequence-binding protein 2 [Rana temporaria]
MQPGDISQVSFSSPFSQETWASKVKQPPKVRIPPATSVKPVCSSPSIAKDAKSQGWNKTLPSPYLATGTEAEEVVAKKKRKKKKKNKQSPNNEHPENEKFANENIVVQEPPKFQDDEEFPDLMSSTGVAERGLRPENRSFSGYSRGPRETLESSKTKGSGRKSKTPVQLDLGGMLAALEHKQHIDKTKPSTKPVVLSVGGGVPVLSREPNNISKIPQAKQGQAPHNPLDSSAPLVKKGKQREVPKAKKPTSLKKIILKEREQKKQQQSSVSQDASQKEEDAHLDDDEEGAVECQDVSEEPFGSPSPEDIEMEMEPNVDCSASTSESSINLSDTASVSIHQPTTNLPKIHSRRFREYCSQVLSKEVDSCVTELLKELVRFQDRLYLKDPVKAKTKRRLVMGLREVLKHLKLKKLKCIIISPNCEKIQSKGGLDDTLQTIISCAIEQNVPFVFALNRKALGRCVNKAVPVSVVGIFSYDGAQDHFHKLNELTMQARQAYNDMICSLQEQQKEDTEDGDEVESVLENNQHKPVEVNAESTADEAEEPNYIKVWKRMLEEQYTPYTPYTLSLEETVSNDLFNFHLS